MKLTVLGIDPSFANMGFCVGNIDTDGIGKHFRHPMQIAELLLVSTEGRDKKEVRKSSDDLRRAKELHTALHDILDRHNPNIVFCEIPHGSQSARASWALGISVGVLASCSVPLIQLSALEVKLASVGNKSASKAQMIDWATKLFPDAEWLKHNKKLVAKNEHLADAVAVINAGMRSDEFERLVAAMNAATHTVLTPARRRVL